jgi:protein TonB
VQAESPKARPKPVTKQPVTRPAPAQVPQPVAIARPDVAPATTAQPTASQVDGAWQSLVASWLVAHKSYPEEARRRGEEGRVVVRFTVDRSGQVIETAIVGSSGSEQLDAAAITLLRSAVLPVFPPSMTQARVTITTSMRYSLR